jgi:hypothetical protein
MLDLGIPLSSKIEVKVIEDKIVPSVNGLFALLLRESDGCARDGDCKGYAILCRIPQQQFHFRQYACKQRANFQDIQPGDAKESAVMAQNDENKIQIRNFKIPHFTDIEPAQFSCVKRS